MLLHCLDNVDGIKKIAKQYVQIDIKVISYIHIWHSYIDPNFALKWCIFLENKKKRTVTSQKYMLILCLYIWKKESGLLCPSALCYSAKRVCTVFGSVPAE